VELLNNWALTLLHGLWENNPGGLATPFWRFQKEDLKRLRPQLEGKYPALNPPLFKNAPRKLITWLGSHTGDSPREERGQVPWGPPGVSETPEDSPKKL